ncbi:hypothetical protein IFM89_022690 [Coptis chinensis]|uniref:ribonuclease P n=1 Tax=Coptis chinensis TaxID=261450 RepID=A0A835LN56_9MAGN|nr:hypothetical protein IFM89_022690 [Coptis chinensis]
MEEKPGNQSNEPNNNKKRNGKKKNQNEESKFMYELGTCSKHNNLQGALSLYQTALSQNLRLNHNHYNTLIYLCSNSLINTTNQHHHDLLLLTIEKGFTIFNRMLSNNINPTEATITSVARLAAAKGDGDFAFQLVKGMGKYKIAPRLRTFDPALLLFCGNKDVDKAYEVEEYMSTLGIQLEELEIGALLKVSGEVGRVEKVYQYLHMLRSCVRCVKVSSAQIIEGWFGSEIAVEVGRVDWDEKEVRDAVLKNGGGWHGQGWLGKGEWSVGKSRITSEGDCRSCGERLVCVDIDRAETEKFAESIAALATERESKSDFRIFQKWLDNNTKYEAIVDGANVGLYQQNFADGGFSISQLDAAVKELYARNDKKWPLVILHNKRVRSLMGNPSNRKLLEEWQTRGTLYTTPNGSNDDWYWLYAAVKLKCLLVTNDEMRDHIFELLGSNFFLKWKERHRVQFNFLKSNLRLVMPPSYSLVIQESEKGSWHVPVEGESSDELLRTWLCITRPSHHECSDEVLISSHAHVVDKPFSSNSMLPSLCGARTDRTVNSSHSMPTLSQCPNDESMTMTGKRKDRSPCSSN